MAAPGVADLFCKAVNEGSLHELKVLTKITDGRQSCKFYGHLLRHKQVVRVLKWLLKANFYDVLKFLVHQLEIST
jgi:hypothetical protein